jgi:hypothetical protein
VINVDPVQVQELATPPDRYGCAEQVALRIKGVLGDEAGQQH